MAGRPMSLKRWLLVGLVALAALLVAAAVVWRDDILRTALDPKIPFQTYDPPPAPDYAQRDAWYLLPQAPEQVRRLDPPADVFFVSPTVFDGGGDWNAPIDDARAERSFRRSVAPNYAGPFVRVGRLFAPRYRQASLYSLLTLRDDAQEARRFAYGDVLAAFRQYRDAYNRGRPFIVVGVEQGGALAARLIAEEIAPNPDLRRRLAAAYLIETVVPAAMPPLPPCVRRAQSGCLAAWASAREGDFDGGKAILERSLVWGPGGQLVNLEGPPLCFNPILGAVSDTLGAARMAQGAANATGLEWGARPPFLTRQVSAQCERGVLRVSKPKSPLLSPTGSWSDRQKVPGFNLFYADLEADAKARTAALMADGALAAAAATTDGPVDIRNTPLRRID